MEIRFTDGSYTDSEGRVMLDPTVYRDWQIGAAAEKALPTKSAWTMASIISSLLKSRSVS